MATSAAGECFPAQRPALIGGSRERKTLRLVAQYADACNLFASSPAEVSHKLEVLRRHCDDETTIRKTILYVGGALASGDGDRFVAEMAEYSRVGIDTKVAIMPIDGRPDVWLEERLGPLAARCRRPRVVALSRTLG